MKKKNRQGFALVEILIAVSILSIVLISVFSGVAISARALSEARNRTTAMQIARSEMNLFIQQAMRGPDLSNEPVSDYRGFTISRETVRYEHPFLGQLPVNKTDITVKWKPADSSHREQKFKLSYIYSE